MRSRFETISFPSPVDRESDLREREGFTGELLADPRLRVIRVRGDRIRCARVSGADRIRYDEPDATERERLAQPEGPCIRLVHLGRALIETDRVAKGSRIVALVEPAPDQPDTESEGGEWLTLRELWPAMDELDEWIATTAVAMSHWHASHRFSPKTGKPLHSEQAGWLLLDDDGHRNFPRTDTAVIVLITDPASDRILLGANSRWRGTRYSLLAGFVEPGETFEEAAGREVLEESGVPITALGYVGSQPWPFPGSIMVGFTAELAPGHDPLALTPQPGEIDDLRWFSRDDLAREPQLLPPRPSIARRLIDEWAGADGAIQREADAR